VRAVNLLPTDAARTRRRVPGAPAVAAAATVVVVSAALGAVYEHERNTVNSRRADLQSLQQQLAALPPAAKTETLPSGLAADQVSRVGALSSVLSHRVAWDPMLHQLALVLPDDVWLTDLKASSPSPVSAATAAAPAPTPAGSAGLPTAFTITGKTYSQESVARLLARLAAVPGLRDVQLQSDGADDSAPNVIDFTIVANLTGGGS
jgi:Tfp pilus assembly protein PilN